MTGLQSKKPSQDGITAVIPARGGSKRLKNKNRLILNGKPLIGWTIEAALQSEAFENIIVSSDDEDILDIASHYNVEIHHRSKSLASDTASPIALAKHLYETQALEGDLCWLQPTSPLRTAHHIKAAISNFKEYSGPSLVSVCLTDHSPLWAGELSENGLFIPLSNASHITTRSQDHPVFYRLNGAIYIAEKEQIFKENTFVNQNTKAFIMDRQSSVDIDDELDFMYATVILQTKS